MMEALPHLPLAQPLLLVVLVVGGLALRQWGRGRAALIGTILIWLALALALVWLGLNILLMLELMQS